RRAGVHRTGERRVWWRLTLTRARDRARAARQSIAAPLWESHLARGYSLRCDETPRGGCRELPRAYPARRRPRRLPGHGPARRGLLATRRPVRTMAPPNSRDAPVADWRPVRGLAATGGRRPPPSPAQWCTRLPEHARGH